MHVVDQDRVPHRPREKLIEPQKKAAHEIDLIEQGRLFRFDDFHDLPGRNGWRGRRFDEFVVSLDKPPGPIPVDGIFRRQDMDFRCKSRGNLRRLDQGHLYAEGSHLVLE